MPGIYFDRTYGSFSIGDNQTYNASVTAGRDSKTVTSAHFSMRERFCKLGVSYDITRENDTKKVGDFPEAGHKGGRCKLFVDKEDASNRIAIREIERHAILDIRLVLQKVDGFLRGLQEKNNKSAQDIKDIETLRAIKGNLVLVGKYIFALAVSWYK